MEDVPDMSINITVPIHLKCGPMRRKPKVLTSLPGTQAFPMATPDVTGDLMMARVFIQSYQFQRMHLQRRKQCHGSNKSEAALVIANRVDVTSKWIYIL